MINLSITCILAALFTLSLQFTIENNSFDIHFSEVFKAKCKSTGRIVALKKILMDNEKEGVSISVYLVLLNFI